MNNNEIEVIFRKIQPRDFLEIKTLHEEFFPVRYNDSFYVDACQGIGMNRGELYTDIVIDPNNNDEIVGFLFAQNFPLQGNSEGKELFEINTNATEACYIMTLGLKKQFRRSKIGSQLVANCIEYAKNSRNCGAVYLHVITYNKPAIRFYENNNFQYFKELFGESCYV